MLATAGVTLTACTAAAPPSATPSSSGAPSATAPSPAASPAASTSVDPETWATHAIPVHTADGGELWRETGVVDGARADYTVTDLGGRSWMVSFACVSADGTPANVTIASDAGTTEAVEVPCAADPSARAEVFRSARNEGTSAALSVESDASTMFVLTVSRDLQG